MIDEILETIAEKIKSIGLDPLPIPDIDLPFSMDNVKFKDHVYRMAIVEGRCTMERSSSLGANLFIG